MTFTHSFIKRNHSLILAGVMTGLAATVYPANEAKEWPDFAEIYRLVSTNLAGVSPQELNRAAVEGFIQQLQPRVWMVEETRGDPSPKAKGELSSTNLYDQVIGYVRVAAVEEGLKAAFAGALAGLEQGHNLKGLVMDLRFADGADYRAAGTVADLFVTANKMLLSYGETTVRASEKDRVVSLPTVVLVNHQTAGAAEALAAILRQSAGALVIGTNTAGRAFLAKKFPVGNHLYLMAAATPILLGDGSTIPAGGLIPDTKVAVSPEDEKNYLADSYKVTAKPEPDKLAAAGTASRVAVRGALTNRPARSRMNEAELVRRQKEGLSPLEDEMPAGATAEAAPPSVQDPALARALDVLKGILVLRPGK